MCPAASPAQLLRVAHASVLRQVAGYGNKYLRPDGETRVTRAHIQAAVDGNLERLGVDHIDLLQVRCGCACFSTQIRFGHAMHCFW